MPAPSFEPGSVLVDKYRIERVLGQGGMGIVLCAYHLQLEQSVALKLMLAHRTTPAAVARFLQEARAAARISSEHVVRVHDVGSLPTGEPYIAMEYLNGSDFAQLLTRQGPFPPQEAVDYLLQACEALAEAHAAGIVHRDLKPGNLYLAQRADGQRLVKVLDFGISKVAPTDGQAQRSLTDTSALMGSPLYMSPEQMASAKQVDARSDIWALGIVLYEMLGGAPPFMADSLPTVCAMVLREEPEPLTTRVPGIAPELARCVERCLQKAPGDRFQSVAALAQALEAFASPRGRESAQRIARSHGRELGSTRGDATFLSAGMRKETLPLTAPHSQTNETWADTQPPPAKPRAGRWLPFALALSLLLVGAGAWRRWAAPPAAPTPRAAESTTIVAVSPVASEQPPVVVAPVAPASASVVPVAVRAPRRVVEPKASAAVVVAAPPVNVAPVPAPVPSPAAPVILRSRL